MTTLDLRGLLAALHDAGVEFVVVGGVAVGAHGYVRATEDLDVVPSPERDNLGRLVRALGDLQATLPLADDRPFDPVADGSRLERRENMTLDTSLGGLDIVQRVAGVPSFETLNAEAVNSDLLEVPVRICSLAHLRRMKAARGATQDQADLEHLPDG